MSDGFGCDCDIRSLPSFYCATQLNTMDVCGTHSKQQIFNVPNVVLQDEDMQKLPFSPFCAKGQKQSCFWLKIVSLPGKFPGYAHTRLI